MSLTLLLKPYSQITASRCALPRPFPTCSLIQRWYRNRAPWCNWYQTSNICKTHRFVLPSWVQDPPLPGWGWTRRPPEGSIPAWTTLWCDSHRNLSTTSTNSRCLALTTTMCSSNKRHLGVRQSTPAALDTEKKMFDYRTNTNTQQPGPYAHSTPNWGEILICYLKWKLVGRKIKCHNFVGRNG